jgi:hypothetical protein
VANDANGKADVFAFAGPSSAGFQFPVLPSGTFQYYPTGSPWTFNGSSGLATSGSAFTSGNPTPPAGNQVAFIQATSSISESVAFLAGTYDISFSAAQRANSQASAQTFQVLVDGKVVGNFNYLMGTSYSTLTTSSFTVGAGNHTIVFQGTDLNGGDNTVLLNQVTINPLPAALNDSDFELPALGKGAFQYNPAGSPWTFSGGAGVAGNGSAFTGGNPNAPQGSQVAFIQGLGSISQSVTFPAGIFAITFSAAQRANVQSSAQTFQVLVDGTAVGSNNELAGTSYTTLTTSNFTVTAGSHTVTFQGTDLHQGDNTIFLDQIAVNTVDFQTPAVGYGAFQYKPAGSSWTFSGDAGLSGNNSAFTSGNPNAPQGSQVAFLQDVGSISQAVTFPAGTYDLSFTAAQRGNHQASAQTFQVLVDGTVVGTFNNLAGTSYTTLTTSSFTVPAGDSRFTFATTITFKATDLNGGDNTVFINQIAINPLPTSLADSGFETPAVGNGGFQYNPAGSPWTFSSSAGLAANGSLFTMDNPSAPQGNQVAFLQAVSSIRQNVTFPSGLFNVKFSAAQRGSSQASLQTFQVLIDGNAVGTFNSLIGTSYTTLTTSTFTVTAGSHTLTFQGTDLNGGDNTVLLDQIVITLLPNQPSDPGFETPVVGNGNFQYDPAGSPWAFSAYAGVAANGSAFTFANPSAPEGNQVAFIQGGNSISQSFTLGAGTYDIGFSAAQRANSQASFQTFQVLIDGNVVGTFNNLTSTSYTSLITSGFTVTSGSHTLLFKGTNLNGGDNTVLLDQVLISPLGP